MSHSELVSLFLALGVVLGTARILGELSRRMNQPAVMGELLAGILLGPTLLGAVAPDVFTAIFPETKGFRLGLEGLTTVAITLFLLVAGIEVDLSTIFRKGRSALGVSVGGIAIPFLIGFAGGWVGPLVLSPEAFGKAEAGSPLVFALFMATAMSISALPVIAKTLMDLNLYRTELGMTVIAAAVFDDLLGWIIFAVILGLMSTTGGEGSGPFPIGATIGLTLAYAVVMLTLGRWILHHSLPLIQAHASWPGGVLGFAIVLALLGASFTEWIGIHAIFGSFLVGVALGDSTHLKERTRQTLESFVTFIFAPLFFATVGLKIDFVANFDTPLVLFVLVIACVGKFVGCGMASRWTGLPWRESWAIGAAMNARGAMEIILALLALEAQLITERLFVALVVMALATSVIAGPIMQRILRRQKPRRFTDFLGSRSFEPRMAAGNRFSALDKLCRISGVEGAQLDEVIKQVLAREHLLASGIGNGVALSHVRLPNIAKPQVALGISRHGLDFDSPDGELCRIVCLILTREEDLSLGLELYRDAASTFRNEALRDKVVTLNNYTEFLALLAEHQGHGAPTAERDKPSAQRAGTLIVGATPTARALAKLLSETQPVRLIDSNATRIEEARREGLTAMAGNALDIEALTEAQAPSMAIGLALTANSEVNALAVRQLREVFQVPMLGLAVDSQAASEKAALLMPQDAKVLFASPIRLNDWDHWFSQGAVAIQRIEAPAENPQQVLADLATGNPALPLVVERGGAQARSVVPCTGTLELAAGDVLVIARARIAAQPTADRFDAMVKECQILDIRKELDRETFFAQAAEALAREVAQTAAQINAALHDRESMSSTVLASGLAIPHIVLEGQKKFTMLVVRCLPGVRFDSDPDADLVNAIFVLAGTPDERNFHLKALSAVVQIWQSAGFDGQWRNARNEEGLRRLLLDTPRQRTR